MKKESRKLDLNRETLQPMQSDELAGVNGGDRSLTDVLSTSSYTPVVPRTISIGIKITLSTRV